VWRRFGGLIAALDERKRPPLPRQGPDAMSNFASRFLGGSPLGVAVRLILLSILVGVVLSALGLDPLNIFRSLEQLIRGFWDMGWDAVRWLWGYFLLGAIIVIPVWLIMRLFRAGTGRR
jgi:hypothetical protein